MQHTRLSTPNPFIKPRFKSDWPRTIAIVATCLGLSLCLIANVTLHGGVQ